MRYALLILLCLPGRQFAQPVRDISFETAVIGPDKDLEEDGFIFDFIDQGETGEVTPEITDILARNGSRSLTCRHLPNSSATTRTEYKMLKSFDISKPWWVGFSVYFPSVTPDPTAWVCFFQVQQEKQSYHTQNHPVAGLYLNPGLSVSGRLKYGVENDIYSSDRVERTDQVPVPTDTWLDFLTMFKYGETDGQMAYYWKRADENTYTLMGQWTDTHVGYTNGAMEWRGSKFGIYRGAQDLEHYWYFDDVRIGNDSAGVIQTPSAAVFPAPAAPAVRCGRGRSALVGLDGAWVLPRSPFPAGIYFIVDDDVVVKRLVLP